MMVAGETGRTIVRYGDVHGRAVGDAFASCLDVPKAVLVPTKRGRDEDGNVSTDNGFRHLQRQERLSMTSEWPAFVDSNY